MMKIVDVFLFDRFFSIVFFFLCWCELLLSNNFFVCFGDGDCMLWINSITKIGDGALFFVHVYRISR